MKAFVTTCPKSFERVYVLAANKNFPFAAFAEREFHSHTKFLLLTSKKNPIGSMLQTLKLNIELFSLYVGI